MKEGTRLQLKGFVMPAQQWSTRHRSRSRKEKGGVILNELAAMNAESRRSIIVHRNLKFGVTNEEGRRGHDLISFTGHL